MIDMKLNRIIQIVFIFLPGVILAQAQTQYQQIGILEARKSVFDFGSIPQGRPVFHVFMLENPSLKPVLIDNVQASCGCTTPEWSREPVSPGGKSEVKVGFNAAAEGPFEKTIQVFYAGGQQIVLTIKGNVWKTPDQPAPPNKIVSSLKTVRLK
jgi:hypothetical protein